MKKVGILTFQNTFNFGALLQNYALFHTLEELSFEPVVVNYRSEAVESGEGFAHPSTLKQMVMFLFMRRKAYLFDSFKHRYLFTPSVTRDGIRKICERLDCVVVGSDQVWNTKITHSDPTYFLDFIDDPRRCKTYAASMGYGELPPCDFDIRSLISHFSSLLVREKTAAETIIRECPDASEPKVVLDPTLLVKRSVWEEIEQLPRYAPDNSYILVYDVSESGLAFDAARSLATKSNAQIIRIQSYDLKPRPGIKSVLNVSPEEYLGLFAHARSTVVSSFHGLCFSIINHRDFYFSGQTTGKNTNSRATDLMDLLGITGRTVNDLADGAVDPIDWDAVEARLCELRADSLQLLIDSLSDVEDE